VYFAAEVTRDLTKST